jgi:hypothetical protein
MNIKIHVLWAWSEFFRVCLKNCCGNTAWHEVKTYLGVFEISREAELATKVAVLKKTE